MNILIITGIFPPDIGGPASYVPQIAKGLTERGHNITVLTLADREYGETSNVNRETGILTGESLNVKRETEIQDREKSNVKRETEIRDRESRIVNSESVSGDQRSEIQNRKSKIGNRKSAIRNPQFQSQIFETGIENRQSKIENSYPFPVFRIPRQLFKPWRWIRTIWTIIRLGRKADVLFVNGLAMESVLSNLFLRKPMVQKVVGDLAWERATNKGWVKDNFEEFQKKRHGIRVELFKALRLWWIQNADRVIVPSQYLARWASAWGVPGDRISVVYNAVEPFNCISPVKLKVSVSPQFNIVTVGRLIPLKRIDRLIEAVSNLDGCSLMVVGEGPQRQSLEALASRLEVSDRVYFTGTRTREEALSLIAACDVFVLNSIHEGFPFVLLEAMALGVPVIATAVGGAPEIVRNEITGLLIGSQRESLESALSKIEAQPGLRESLAKTAQKVAAEYFDSETMISRTEAVIEASTTPEQGQGRRSVNFD